MSGTGGKADIADRVGALRGGVPQPLAHILRTGAYGPIKPVAETWVTKSMSEAADPDSGLSTVHGKRKQHDARRPRSPLIAGADIDHSANDDGTWTIDRTATAGDAV